jgi:hypothetical protein
MSEAGFPQREQESTSPASDIENLRARCDASQRQKVAREVIVCRLPQLGIRNLQVQEAAQEACPEHRRFVAPSTK